MENNTLKRHDRIVKVMSKNNLSAIIAMSLENVYYSTGSYIVTQKDIRDRLEIAIFSENHEPTFIICGIEEQLVKSTTWINNIITYVEFKESPINILIDLIKKMGIGNNRIGIEMQFLGASEYISLTKGLPNAEFVDSKHVFDEVRMIKEPREIEILARGANGTRKSIEAAFIACNIGDTEKILANKMITNLFHQGADELQFLNLASGERTLLSHPIADQTKLKEGDIVKVDFGGVFTGYFSDIARTAVVGKPSIIQADIYKKLIHIEKELIDKLKIGVKASSIYKKCEELFNKNGLPFTPPHIGHGLGIGIHEIPIINPLDETEFQENMVICLEPVVTFQGFGYHVEDTIQITKNGPKILSGTKFNDQIPIID